MDVHAAEAIGAGGVVTEDLELIPVVTIEPVLCSEPNETLVVLHNLLNTRLRQTLRGGKPTEAQGIGIHHRKLHGLRTDACLDYPVLRGAQFDLWILRRSGQSRLDSEYRHNECTNSRKPRRIHISAKNESVQ